MTDYERDYQNWKVQHDYSYYTTKEPNLDDYDENGYRKGSVKYEDNLILDPYLISVYGIEYARQHPLKKL